MLVNAFIYVAHRGRGNPYIAVPDDEEDAFFVLRHRLGWQVRRRGALPGFPRIYAATDFVVANAREVRTTDGRTVYEALGRQFALLDPEGEWVDIDIE